MSDTPVFDEVSEAFNSCKEGWRKQVLLEVAKVLEEKLKDHKCDKKKCETKCASFDAGYSQAVTYLKDFK